jgi:hypothetical protein
VEPSSTPPPISPVSSPRSSAARWSARHGSSGNCSGAILGLLAYEMIPSRIRRFVLIDPFAFLPWYFKVFVHPSFGRLAYHSPSPTRLALGRQLSLKNRRAADSDLQDRSGT